MKANELSSRDLMVGDWLMFYDKPCQVKGLHNDDTVTLTGYRSMYYLIDAEPIPLTPEILKKNDILYRKSSFYYIINDDKDLECTHYIYQTVQEDWAIGVDTGAYDCSVFARIKYVHELQHALKLCGIEKEIKL